MNDMGRETTYPAKKQELFYFDDKKDVYRPLTENGAIPVVIKGGNVGGGTGAASTGEVTIKNDKLVVQLVDKLLETKVTNDSLNVQVLNPVETVKANITNKSMDVNVLNPVTETTIKNKTLDVKITKPERNVISLFGGKLELASAENPETDTGHVTDFIDVDSYNQLAFTSMISGKGVDGGELKSHEIQQFNTRLDAYLEWSHDGVNVHGIAYPMGMSPDDTCIKANGKYIDILSKYVRVRVKGSHGGDWKPILDLRMVLK
ncbi:hypothetical protein [Bacillus thuringiensis]|uniref:hypothetical protein n=1 Tax=Bacillus thuringiensis TaxID=1428 RepID=UPI0026E39C7C|nr:hypothetical protein [Bacillus thuringiensis]MDO6628719.1 hypothetical protein [Bacillus thuringiensis]MDO6659156.1 hypothetical protein [Bacillus thuringiensis]MDO6698942.1 hypothetical protein [Bacillus thuringiensis]